MKMKFKALPKDRPIRMAVIGVGSVAQVFHLPIISAMEEIELAGVADVDSYKVGRIAEKYSVPGFVDSENLLRTLRPDVVIICTPTISHLPLALAALQSGSHVILEKPATRDLDETKRLASLTHERNLLTLVAMNHRFRQDVFVLRNFLKSGELGEIWRVRAGWLKRISEWDNNSWRDQKKISGGGVLLDLGLQMLDFIYWLLNMPEAKRIVGFASHQSLQREVEDTATVTIIFEGGTMLNLDCSWGLMAEGDLAYAHFEGTNGSARLNPLVLHKTLQGELVNVTPVKSADPWDLFRASFEAQLHHFVRALRGEVEPVSTIDEAVKVMSLIELIYQSVENGREIVTDAS